MKITIFNKILITKNDMNNDSTVFIYLSWNNTITKQRDISVFIFNKQDLVTFPQDSEQVHDQA